MWILFLYPFHTLRCPLQGVIHVWLLLVYPGFFTQEDSINRFFNLIVDTGLYIVEVFCSPFSSCSFPVFSFVSCSPPCTPKRPCTPQNSGIQHLVIQKHWNDWLDFPESIWMLNMVETLQACLSSLCLPTTASARLCSQPAPRKYCQLLQSLAKHPSACFFVLGTCSFILPSLPPGEPTAYSLSFCKRDSYTWWVIGSCDLVIPER